MTTRKRVGGGFKIVHPKEQEHETEHENLKEHHSNSEKKDRRDEIITYEIIDLDVKSNGGDSIARSSVELLEINNKSKEGFAQENKRQYEKLELPAISPDKSTSLVASREGTEKTDSSTEKLKVRKALSLNLFRRIYQMSYILRMIFQD